MEGAVFAGVVFKVVHRFVAPCVVTAGGVVPVGNVVVLPCGLKGVSRGRHFYGKAFRYFAANLAHHHNFHVAVFRAGGGNFRFYELFARLMSVGKDDPTTLGNFVALLVEKQAAVGTFVVCDVAVLVAGCVLPLVIKFVHVIERLEHGVLILYPVLTVGVGKIVVANFARIVRNAAVIKAVGGKALYKNGAVRGRRRYYPFAVEQLLLSLTVGKASAAVPADIVLHVAFGAAGSLLIGNQLQTDVSALYYPAALGNFLCALLVGKKFAAVGTLVVLLVAVGKAVTLFIRMANHIVSMIRRFLRVAGGKNQRYRQQQQERRQCNFSFHTNLHRFAGTKKAPARGACTSTLT